jgi:uncharacterized protein (TIGR03084 family)
VDTTLPELLGDLEGEYVDLRRRVGPFASADPRWDLPTPADGWMVRDQISHLAYFDRLARRAVTDPVSFAQEAEELMGVSGDPMEEHLRRGRSMSGDELLAWWDDEHGAMATAFAGVAADTKVPWFGPPMGILSFASSRLMEAWAHGQDVVDALGIDRPPTDRLRHVAHLGVRTRPFSYALHGREVPPGRVEVDLASPSGELWRWDLGERLSGEDSAFVVGEALDFCLVVSQRRNLADTRLVVTGPSAADWLSIAQVFAGPPGPGRPPGGPRSGRHG